MAGNSTESGRSASSEIISILLAFSEGTVHTLTEVARLAGLPLSTAHGLICELAALRILERTADGTFRGGQALRMIGAASAAGPQLRERAALVMEDLATITGKRVRLGVLRQHRVAYIEKAPGPEPSSSFSTDATLPVHPTAMGRALLAFSGSAMIESTIRRGLPAYTNDTVTSPEWFRRAVAVTRLTRVALGRGDFESGVGAAAMPVFGPGGYVVAALELSMADLGIELGPNIVALTIASRSLSRELAGDPRSARGAVDVMAPGIRISVN